MATTREYLNAIMFSGMLDCLESQMRATAHLPKCKAEPMLKDAIDEYENAHK